MLGKDKLANPADATLLAPLSLTSASQDDQPRIRSPLDLKEQSDEESDGAGQPSQSGKCKIIDLILL
jgi:hypothetical protein